MIRLIVFILIGAATVTYGSQFSSNDSLEADATITDISTGSSQMNYKCSATVDYTTQDKVQLQSQVQIVNIPFIGCKNKVGDTVTVQYRPVKPDILTTPLFSFVNKYGLPLLISFGVIFGLRRPSRPRRRRKVQEPSDEERGT